MEVRKCNNIHGLILKVIKGLRKTPKCHNHDCFVGTILRNTQFMIMLSSVLRCWRRKCHGCSMATIATALLNKMRYTVSLKKQDSIVIMYMCIQANDA